MSKKKHPNWPLEGQPEAEPNQQAYSQPYPPPTKLDPWQHSSARLLQDRNATVAEVTLVQRSSYDGPADFEFKVTGSSKREKGDRFNARTGELLALSRAYLHLSRKLYAAGRELVEEPAEGELPDELEAAFRTLMDAGMIEIDFTDNEADGDGGEAEPTLDVR